MLLGAGIAAAQHPSSPAPAKPNQDSASSPDKSRAHNPSPPRSDRVDAATLPDDPGDSSSKDTQVDLSPPPGDARDHPNSDMLKDEGSASGGDSGDTTEFHPWDPHRAAKNIEVGDYYFKRKNYVGAESRYREALYYKNNDAEARYKHAVCLEKMDHPDEAIAEYQTYLKTLPNGPDAANAKQAIERLNNPAVAAKPKH